MRTKFFHLYANAVGADGKNHIVTIVGKLVQSKKMTEFTETVPVEFKPGAYLNGELKFQRNIFNRKLTLGMSICHPLDNFDIEQGVEIAKARIEKGETLGSLETSSVTMLTDDAVMAELLVKLNYVTEHIDDYLPLFDEL